MTRYMSLAATPTGHAATRPINSNHLVFVSVLLFIDAICSLFNCLSQYLGVLVNGIQQCLRRHQTAIPLIDVIRKSFNEPIQFKLAQFHSYGPVCEFRVKQDMLQRLPISDLFVSQNLIHDTKVDMPTHQTAHDR